MEKFGIFELLDALSAACDAQEEEHSPQPAPKPPPEKKEPDSSFAAPSYGETAEKTPLAGSALDGFYARHEQAKSRIRKK